MPVITTILKFIFSFSIYLYIFFFVLRYDQFPELVRSLQYDFIKPFNLLLKVKGLKGKIKMYQRTYAGVSVEKKEFL